MKKSGNIIAVVVIAAITIAAVASVIAYMSRPQPVILQGEAVASSYKVSSKLVGRVDSLELSVGDYVEKGAFVFSLSTPEIDAKLKQAEALLNAAGAKESLAKEGLHPEQINAIMSQWTKANAGLEFAQTTYDRVKSLYNDGVVPQQKYDEAKAQLKAMQSSVDGAKALYLQAVDGARTQDKTAASALVAQASGGVSEVEAYLKDAVQYASVSGEVSSVLASKGELVNSGFPVVTITDLNDIWFSFNIKESYLPAIKKDQIIEIFVPALDRHIAVKVYFMSVQPQYATWSATRSKGEYDIKSFEVRMRPVAAVEGLRPGMSGILNWSNI